jgi:natural product biosynthesis luciferase-like monooxygenase protein
MIDKKSLAIAVPDKNVYLTYSDLIRHTYDLGGCLNGIHSIPKILLILKESHNLYIALYNLFDKEAELLIVDYKKQENIDVEKIKDWAPDICITDTILPTSIGSICSSFYINELPLSSEKKIRHSGDIKTTIGFIQANAAIEILNIGEVNRILKKLDDIFVPKKSDVLLISGENRFYEFVIEAIWVISRHISMVYKENLNQADLVSMIPNGETFNMDFGVFFFGDEDGNDTNKKYDLVSEVVKYADCNGYSAAWTPERHFNEFGGLFPNPSVLSAALAMVTNHIDLRAGSIVSPLHHPVRIAEEWALVDNLSQGRVGLSFGSGWQCDDFIFNSQNYKMRHEIMLQQIETVRKLWAGESVAYQNGLDKTIEIKMFPKPFSKDLPLWITVSGKKETFIDAGRIGANILTHLLWQNSNELPEKISAYKESLILNGFDPKLFKVTVMVHTYLGKDTEEVKKLVEGPLKKYIRSSAFLIESMAKSNNSAKNREVGGRYGAVSQEISEKQMNELLDIAFERFFNNSALLGSVKSAEKLMKEIKSYGVDEIACLVDFGLNNHEIKKGLEYLTTLKNKYDKRSSGLYDITLLHCPEHIYDEMKGDSRSSDILDSLRRVLINTTNEYPEVKKANKNCTYTVSGPVLSLEGLFKSNISSDFPITSITGTISEDF